MSRMVRVGLVLVAALSLGLVGCGDGEQPAAKGGKPGATPKAVEPTGPQAKDFMAEGGTPVAAKTPQEAWLNFEEAYHTGNAAMYMSSILAPEEVKPHLESDVAHIGALRRLKTDMTKAYGAEALEGLFQGIKTSEFDRQAAAEDLKIEMKGEDAAAGQKGDGNAMQLTRKDGIWHIDLTKMPFPPVEEGEENHKANLALVKAVAFVLPKVGTSPYPKVEDILKLLSTSRDAFLKAAP